MPQDTFTMAQMLKDAGYTTGLFGKWGLGAPDSVSEPLKMGFDRMGIIVGSYFHIICGMIVANCYGILVWRWNLGAIHDEVMSFIETHKDKPFYCFYALIQPHAEMFAPEEYMEISGFSSRELVCGYGWGA